MKIVLRNIMGGLLVASCLALSGCSSLNLFGKGDAPTTGDASADKMFREAKDALNSGDYARSIKLLEAFESKYPYGAQAQQAIVDIAWANYKIAEYPQAVSGAERFIKLYPTHVNVDYAYYLKGLALFGDELGLFKFLANEDISERDPKARREAYQAFKELAEKYPSSSYAADARLRMQHLHNSLAEYDVHVARYYYKRGAHVAAVNRAQLALTTYPDAPATKEALQILAQGYAALGQTQLANDTQRVLERTHTEVAKANAANSSNSAVKKPWWKLW
jgi:outer membrane protein assembly factor BamD